MKQNNRFLKFIVFLFVLIFFQNTSFCAKKHVKPKKHPSPFFINVSTLPGNEITIVSSSFGKIKIPSKNKKIVQYFSIKNDLSTPLTIDQIMPTCSCLTVATENNKSKIPISIASGKNFSFHLTVDLSKEKPGHIKKSTWIFMNKNSVKPARILQVEGDLVKK
jgi:hypothetical protein